MPTGHFTSAPLPTLPDHCLLTCERYSVKMLVVPLDRRDELRKQVYPEGGACLCLRQRFADHSTWIISPRKSMPTQLERISLIFSQHFYKYHNTSLPLWSPSLPLPLALIMMFIMIDFILVSFVLHLGKICSGKVVWYRNKFTWLVHLSVISSMEGL
jgi:hypothetical protein